MPEVARSADVPLRAGDPTLTNADLAPVPPARRNWGWFEIFSVWSNSVQSLFGYTLAASLFLTYGLNGWLVFAAILVAGVIIAFFVNLSGIPSVRYGIPYPVMARVSMGVRGANLPALVRGMVAIFWYGAQTYIASTAVALLIRAFVETSSTSTLLGLTVVDWFAFVIVWAFQMALFWRGIEWIRVFLNWAAPAVYAVMIALTVVLWTRAGDAMLASAGTIFAGNGTYAGGTFAAFLAVVGTMIAYFAAVMLNFGDFSRYVRSTSAMRLGNVLGIPVGLAFFSLIALLVTAGTVVVFGERLTDPTQMVERVDNVALTIVAALTFFVATVGINVVSNFVPAANDISNLMPAKISFRLGGIIAASIAFVVGAFWVSVINQIGVVGFVNTLAALVAPAYGVMICDYYVIKRQHVDVEQLYSADPGGAYYYTAGWNMRGVIALAVGAACSIASVWHPGFAVPAGFDWVLGAAIAGGVYFALMTSAKRKAAARPTQGPAAGRSQ
ncbi:NCS1 family nucleobase:cation symporter-1 [Bauldia sp.]|uniref:NCS1 family nucleobase:cation symporter-1 n=1 Tax=Bauldia sp. TaxID=2575872 RepID=UPI003BAC5A2E